MSVSPLAIVLALLAAAGVALIVRALLVPPQTETDLLEARLAPFEATAKPLSSLTEVELSLPFFERAIRPAFDRLSQAIAARMPAQAREALEDQLDLAGRPFDLTVGGYQAVRLIAVVVGVAVAYLISRLLGTMTVQVFAAILVAGGIVGVLVPRYWLANAARRRAHEILLGLPSALDLITISVEAGLSFDAAVARVTEKYKNALALEFSQFLNEIKLGVPRVQALDAMGRRSRVPDFNNFVQAIIQSEQLGVGIANVLRVQSEELRRRRRQRAEEAGQKAPLKMLFPMVGCIFPVLFIVLLGPAALLVAQEFSGH